MSQYKANTSNCNYEIFMKGLKKSTVVVIGSNEGAEFQSFSRECPSFATEYAMVIFRLNRNHYGPINRKEAEYTLVCHEMLKQVEGLVECVL